MRASVQSVAERSVDRQIHRSISPRSSDKPIAILRERKQAFDIVIAIAPSQPNMQREIDLGMGDFGVGNLFGQGAANSGLKPPLTLLPMRIAASPSAKARAAVQA